MYSIIRFGLLYGLALVIAFFASHLALGTKLDTFTIGETFGYSLMIISALAMVMIMGIKDYKQKRAPAPLGFMAALAISLGISLIAAHVFALYSWLYVKFINPTFTTTYLQYSEQKIISSGLEPIVVEQQLAQLTYYADLMSNNFTQSMLVFTTMFIIGLLFSLISALALRTPRK
jgi:hypothetical protein